MSLPNQATRILHMSGRVELEACHENPAAISRVVCASDLERPPGTLYGSYGR